MDDEAKRRTQETANKLFGKGIKMDPPYRTWKEFDKDLANDLSLFITGNLYSRTVLTLQERQMAACAMLAALKARDELKLHLNAALNVGCDPRKLTEVFFQLAPYGGMPAVNEALQVFREVLKERASGRSIHGLRFTDPGAADIRQRSIRGEPMLWIKRETESLIWALDWQVFG